MLTFFFPGKALNLSLVLFYGDALLSPPREREASPQQESGLKSTEEPFGCRSRRYEVCVCVYKECAWPPDPSLKYTGRKSLLGEGQPGSRAASLA